MLGMCRRWKGDRSQVRAWQERVSGLALWSGLLGFAFAGQPRRLSLQGWWQAES